MVRPGVSRGTSTIDCWRWVSASGSVLPMTMKISHRVSATPVIHHLRPLITYSSPSRRMTVCTLVASEEATSGVMAYAERIVPSLSGSRYFFFCSSVPKRWKVSMLPVSGACELIASGAMTGDQPEISDTAANSRLEMPDHSGRKRFHRPRRRASALRSSMIGG